MTRVLVAGASGKLGQEVCAALLREGATVRALGRRPDVLAATLPAGIEIAAGDVVSGAGLEAALESIDVVFSAVGGSIAFRAPRSGNYREVDFRGNSNLLAAAKSAKVRRFVYISVFGAATHPELEYLAVHEQVSRLLISSGLEVSILEPTGFFSALEMLLGIARSGFASIIGDGSARSNPIADSDLAMACAESILATNPPQRRPIGGHTILTRRQMFEAAFTALDKKPRIFSIPAWPIKIFGAALRPFAPRLSALLAFYRTVAVEDAIAPAFGTKRLEDHLREAARGPRTR